MPGDEERHLKQSSEGVQRHGNLKWYRITQRSIIDWTEAQDVYKELMRDKLVSDRGAGQQKSSKEFISSGANN